jgi:hypothetical protein
MDDFDRGDFDYLPGVDLFLWLRIVLAVLALVALGTVAVVALG